LKGVDLESFRSQNLIGSPQQIIGGIERLRDAGATQLAGMIVVADTEADMREQMEIFAGEVMPAFTGAAS
jgi:hypothetical protein